MARSRNIKPGFFMNDTLAEVEPLGRLLFAGLWCVADREGRLEDRPRRIKAEVLPYDDCDVDQLLDQLVKYEFIQRYQVDGEQYIQIINFSKHQNPHRNEAPSTIPAPEQSGALPTSPDPAPDKHSTSTVQVPDKHSTNRADSLNLIPDSLYSDTCPTSDDADGDAEPPSGGSEESVPIPCQLALHLRARILDNLPTAKVPPGTPAGLKKWGIEIDRMIRLDKRDPVQIRAVIDWCQADPFWSGNILSAGSLRKHWDKLVLQMQRDKPRPGSGYHKARGKPVADNPWDNLDLYKLPEVPKGGVAHGRT